jgi:hypothetical protein
MYVFIYYLEENRDLVLMTKVFLVFLCPKANGKMLGLRFSQWWLCALLLASDWFLAGLIL